jgi:hypothetical protein
VAAAVVANYEAERDAMVAGDADALGRMLAEGFTLTHMTGYRQPKEEWLTDIRIGAMTYHAVNDVDLTVEVDPPVVTVRTRTEATMWGGHGIWHLQLRFRFVFVDGVWLASDAVASTWR